MVRLLAILLRSAHDCVPGLARLRILGVWVLGLGFGFRGLGGVQVQGLSVHGLERPKPYPWAPKQFLFVVFI